jgi:hypothetical protein
MPTTPAHALKTNGPETEAPGPSNQGAPAKELPGTIVGPIGRPRYYPGEPLPGRVLDGQKIVGWHRTDTTVNGQRLVFGQWYTYVGIELANGETVYAVAITSVPL